MSTYRFQATRRIAEEFESRHIPYCFEEDEEQEAIGVGISISCGPKVVLYFISTDDDNDVSVRILGLVTDVPEYLSNRMLQACNTINSVVRYAKFSLGKSGRLDVEYDFLQRVSEERIGDLAFEVLIRFTKILDQFYPVFMKALYTEDDLWDAADTCIGEKNLGEERRGEVIQLCKEIDRLKAQIEERLGITGDEEENPDDDWESETENLWNEIESNEDETDSEKEAEETDSEKETEETALTGESEAEERRRGDMRNPEIESVALERQRKYWEKQREKQREEIQKILEQIGERQEQRKKMEENKNHMEHEENADPEGKAEGSDCIENENEAESKTDAEKG